jgi:hypothetical protein
MLIAIAQKITPLHRVSASSSQPGPAASRASRVRPDGSQLCRWRSLSFAKAKPGTKVRPADKGTVLTEVSCPDRERAWPDGCGRFREGPRTAVAS